jgi:adenylylsulfate kinase
MAENGFITGMQECGTTARQRLHGHAPAVLWFTGLSGAGKSTLASAAEQRLHALGCRTFVLDGDKLRHGLCSDLGFSNEDRHENIRRAGEVASLFVQSGAIVLAALISPFAQDRERARRLVPEGHFFEIYCNASVTDCERRDVKGLYRRARAGEVKEFSGISSPYEPPTAPELVLHTARDSIEQCLDAVLRIYHERLS